MNLNIFSKDFWEMKPTREFIQIFTGVANIKISKDYYEKTLNEIPGLIFNKDIWTFTITCVVQTTSTTSLYFFQNSQNNQNYYKYILNGTRQNNDSWNFKVDNLHNGPVTFSIQGNQIMYSSDKNFTMKYIIDYF